MSDRGVFAVDRGIFTDPDFADEPFTEREAFLWLVAEAAWKERRVRSGSSTVDIQRGQLCHSVRFMAEAWRWSKSRVDRFLSRLENRDTIRRNNGTAQSVVTICKYEEFQRVSMPERDSNGTPAGTEMGQRRDKLEDIKNIKTHTSSTASDRRIFREAFWPKYPKRQGSNPPDPAEAAYLKAIKNGATHEEIAAGLEGYSAQCRSTEILNTKFVAMASTWLNQGRWKEFVGPRAQSAPTAAASSEDYLAKLTDDRWRDALRQWKKTGGQWDLSRHSSPPDSPKTKVPQRFLTEFGITPRDFHGVHNLLSVRAA